MTELLGNKFSVESLRKDAQDVNSVLANLTSRLGHVSFSSWKFPDKLAVDVDIPDLLEMYEYDEEFPEENKIAHIMLLELLIDR